MVENAAGSIVGEYGSVIFIGALLEGTEEAPGFGAGAGLPPQAATSTITDQTAPIADRRAAMFMHGTLDPPSESRPNFLAVDAAGAELVLQ